MNIKLPTWHFPLDIMCLSNCTCSKAFLVSSPEPGQSGASHTLVDNHAFPVAEAKSPGATPDLPLRLTPPHQDTLVALPPKYIQNPSTSQNPLMVLSLTKRRDQSPCEGSHSHTWCGLWFHTDLVSCSSPLTLLLGLWPLWRSLSLPGTGEASPFNYLRGSLPHLQQVLAQMLSSQPIMTTPFI